jgi:hypothetical protein
LVPIGLLRLSDRPEDLVARQYELSKGDVAVVGLAVLLIVDLLWLPWFSSDGFSVAAAASPYGWPAVIAIMLSLLVIVDLIVERFAPQVILPTIGGSRAATRFSFASVSPLFVLLKLVLQWSLFKSLLFHVLGVGFWGALLLAVALVVASQREM